MRYNVRVCFYGENSASRLTINLDVETLEDLEFNELVAMIEGNLDVDGYEELTMDILIDKINGCAVVDDFDHSTTGTFDVLTSWWDINKAFENDPRFSWTI